MANLTGFDANEWEPNVPFEPVPAGDYKCVIVESEMKPTKAEDGKYLELKLQIVDGEFANRNLWDRLNLVNENEKAVEIAKRTLSAVCRAVGKMTPRQSEELHNVPMLVKVGVEKRQDNGELSNRVKGYKAVNGSNGGPHLSQAVPTTKPSQPADTKKAPWAR